jgi:hypothetical protein
MLLNSRCNHSLMLLKMGKNCPKRVELIHRSKKLLLLHLVGHLYYSPVMISSSFVFCCMFLYISFYGAMTGTILCFNFRHIPMKYSTSKKLWGMKAFLQRLVVSWGLFATTSEYSPSCGSLNAVNSSVSSSVNSAAQESRTYSPHMGILLLELAG